MKLIGLQRLQNFRCDGCGFEGVSQDPTVHVVVSFSEVSGRLRQEEDAKCDPQHAYA